MGQVWAHAQWSVVYCGRPGLSPAVDVTGVYNGSQFPLLTVKRQGGTFPFVTKVDQKKLITNTAGRPRPRS